jgi:endonuclease/exonuclease/phosphatase family metal-dependent hydrolase
MRGLLAVAVWLLLALAPGFGQTQAPASFSVCWWNLENWGETDRTIDGVRVASAMKPPAEVSAVLAILKRIHPDILGVAEIVQAPDDRFLKLLREMLARQGLDYPYLSTVHGQDTRIQTALLSRFPIRDEHPFDRETFPVSMQSASTGERRGGEFRTARGFINSTVEVAPGLSVEIIVAHLKAKLPEKEVVGDEPGESGDEYVRTQEARLLYGHAAHVLHDNPGANLLVMGDLNDISNSRALKRFFGSPEHPSPLHGLPLADWLGDGWTHIYFPTRSYERIDYMFASEALQARFLPSESFLFRRAATDGSEFDAATASDHRPLVARFRTP